MNDSIKLSVVVAIAILSALIGAETGFAQQPQDRRLALVIGESAYSPGPLATAANDAGLVANTLSEAGFEVIGARDLDQDGLRRSLRELLDKATAAGPNSTVFVYLAGYGLQLEGENFVVPVGARIARDTDVPIEALRFSDFSRSLAAVPLRARIIVFDGAHSGPFAKSGPPLASGLALLEPDPGTLIAFNGAPGTVAPAEAGPYSVYAQALTEMMRDGGLPLSDVFARTRLRVSERTKGAVVPWDANKIEQPFSFFDRAAEAPPPAAAGQRAALQGRSIRELTPEEAYGLAVERDTISAYEEFVAAFPDHPLAKRVRAMLAARREAITWRRTVSANAPNAYWSYLKRYPNGPHAADARRRLARLTAPLVPPPVFDAFDYDVPPPPPDEYVIVDRPIIIFDEPDYDPPPPLPVYLLPPPSPDWLALPPPPPPPAPFYLPIPVPIPIPGWSRPPQGPVVTAPLPVQPGSGRPLPPPVVPVGAGFIQPPQAIISRPPTTTRPATLPGQPGSPITAPAIQAPPTTSGTPAPTVPANPVLSPNTNLPAPVNPGQLPLPPKPGQNLAHPNPPGTQPLPVPGANGLPAAGAAPAIRPAPTVPANPVLSPNTNLPATVKPGQLPLPPKPGQNLAHPNPPGTQPLPVPGANGLPAAGATIPQGKTEHGRKPGTPGGLPGAQNPITQTAPVLAPGGGQAPQGNAPSPQVDQTPKTDTGAAGSTRQQQLLQQKQQMEQQKAQQQQLRQQQLEQQKAQQQQNLQQKNLQLQQLRQQQLEQNKTQQQQIHQQQIEQQQIHQQEIRQQQQHIQQQQIQQQQNQQQQHIQQQQIQQQQNQQQQIRQQQIHQQRIQQQQIQQPQIQQQQIQQQQIHQQQMQQQQMQQQIRQQQIQQQQIQQQQIQQQQIRAQQQGQQPAHPNCGQAGVPPCPR